MSGPSRTESSQVSVLSYVPRDKEIAPKKQFTIAKISTLAILASLALGALVAGISLTIVLGNPVFLALLITTALFSVVTFLVYHQMTSKVSSNWQKALEQNFKPLGKAWQEKNVDCYSNEMQFYNNHLNPKFKVAIQTDASQPFQPTFLTGLRVIEKNQSTGIIFNPVGPTNLIDNTATNLSTILYSTLKDKSVWDTCKQREGDPAKGEDPFSPTEVRVVKLPNEALDQTFNLNLSSAEKKSILPTFLGHVCGPKSEELPNQQEYYRQALLAYENCLKAAIESHAAIVALPLFTSVYEVPPEEILPKEGTFYWDNQTQAFCKRALLDAIQNTALRYPQRSLLVILQDPFNTIESQSRSEE
ncbi:conserved hypothetical protein [Chlamydia pneumoniae LPCoLN]|uniref:hypothetical protein n=1 Tax=Chlamydia pneumoniae TaxID=83558 RepID=UPI0001BD9E69|nr:hypothetical protein [Chlamydia pneumoniae]ACZ33499.1 conserved hypothetical protein [Chlamydia pneumoniae LPCoLN]ETR80424.1 hypothetical protein X556_0243 [Chlamydia pneumoniae B21]